MDVVKINNHVKQSSGSTINVNNQVTQSRATIVGVVLLRLYMCYLVVNTHLGGTMMFEAEGLLYVFQAYHVPVFMLLSFVLCAKYFLEPTKEGIVKRILRCLIPFAFWGIVSFLLELVFYRMDFTTLLWQLFTGLPVNVSMWYLIILFWISILFWTIRLLTNRKVFLIVISALAVFSIISQYTGLNMLVFSNAPYNIQKSFGRAAEMLPLATLGILLALLVPYLSKLKKRFHVIIFISSGILLVLFLLLKWLFPSFDKFPGQDYNGLFLIVMSILLVATAYTNPLNFIENETFIKITKWVGKYTMGIYCIHIVLGLYLAWLFGALGWPSGTMLIVVVAYLLSYLISFLISLIPNKYVRMLVD